MFPYTPGHLHFWRPLLLMRWRIHVYCKHVTLLLMFFGRNSYSKVRSFNDWKKLQCNYLHLFWHVLKKNTSALPCRRFTYHCHFENAPTFIFCRKLLKIGIISQFQVTMGLLPFVGALPQVRWGRCLLCKWWDRCCTRCILKSNLLAFY